MNEAAIFEHICWELCKIQYKEKLVLSKGVVASRQNPLFPSFYIDSTEIVNVGNHWCHEADVVVLNKEDIFAINTSTITSDIFIESKDIDIFFENHSRLVHNKAWWRPYQTGLKGIKRDWQLVENDKDNCPRKRKGSSINFKYKKSPEVILDAKYYHTKVPKEQIKILLQYAELMRAKESILMIPGNHRIIPEGYEVYIEHKRNDFVDSLNLQFLWNKIDCQSIYFVKI